MPADRAAGQRQPAFVPHPDQQQLFEEGVAKAEAFRQRLIGKDTREIVAIAKSIVLFAKKSKQTLTDRGSPSTAAFSMTAGDISNAVVGTLKSNGTEAFQSFAGKWYGEWDGKPVDHDWSEVAECVPAHQVSTADFKKIHVHAGQYAWVGDGFGWNLLCSERARGERYILGAVYHVENGDRKKVTVFRPHVGVALDAQRLIWITPNGAYLEEVFPSPKTTESRYVITGFDYEMVDGVANQKEQAFQAIYTRDPKNRPAFTRFAN